MKALRWRRQIPALGALLAITVAPAAFGETASTAPLPANAVVRVGDAIITRTTFKRWFNVAAASNPATQISYDPPDFVHCIKGKRKLMPRTRRRPTTAQLRTQCKEEYKGLRDQVLQFLILEKWVSGEAAAQDVTFTDAELDKAFRQAKRDTFPKDSDFRKFLKQSGMTEADARFQVTFNTVYTKLRELAIAAAAPVTDTEVSAFYGENVDRFALPERRDVRAVLTKTRGRANAARAALERGQTWRHVARKFSIDEASRHNGGLLREIGKGSQEKDFDDAVFRAPQGKLRGPVKVQFGYYVFKVLKILPAEQQTLAQATPAIRQELEAEHQRDADDAFNTNLRATWRPRTTCRAGYVMDQCSNGPDPPPLRPPDEAYPDL